MIAAGLLTQRYEGGHAFYRVAKTAPVAGVAAPARTVTSSAAAIQTVQAVAGEGQARRSLAGTSVFNLDVLKPDNETVYMSPIQSGRSVGEWRLFSTLLAIVAVW